MDMVSVADPQGDRHGVAETLEVLGDVEALTAAGINAAVVAVPTYLHEEVGVAMAAGVPTMVEKLVAASAESSARVTQAFTDADRVGAVGCLKRCNPPLLRVRRLIKANELAEVLLLKSSRQGPFPAQIVAVGVVRDLSTHNIDLMAWIARPPYAAVSGQVTQRSGRKNEDMVVATRRLANGASVSHLVNCLSPMKVRQTVSTGEKGAPIVGTLSGDLTFVANGDVSSEWARASAFRGVSEGDSTRHAIARREPLRVEQENFCDAFWGRPFEAGLMAEGVRSLRVVGTLLASATTGHTVAL